MNRAPKALTSAEIGLPSSLATNPVDREEGEDESLFRALVDEARAYREAKG